MNEPIRVEQAPEPLRIKSSPRMIRSQSLKNTLVSAISGLVIVPVAAWIGLHIVHPWIMLGGAVLGGLLGTIVARRPATRITLYEDRIVGPGNQELPIDHVVRGGFLEPDPPERPFSLRGIGPQSILGNGGSEIVIYSDHYEPEDRERLRQELLRRIEQRGRLIR